MNNKYLFYLLFISILLITSQYLTAAEPPNTHGFKPKLFDRTFQTTSTPISSSTISTLSQPSSINDSTPSFQSDYPSTNTNITTPNTFYLIQTKPDYSAPFEQLTQQINEIIQPYYINFRINRELTLISGPMNPFIHLISEISTQLPQEHSILDLLSFFGSNNEELQSKFLHSSTNATPQQLTQQIEFITFLKRINQIPGILGLTSYSHTMKISTEHTTYFSKFFQPNVNEFISSLDNQQQQFENDTYNQHSTSNTTPHQSQLERVINKITNDVEYCLYQIYFDQNQSNKRPTDGNHQIESDSYLDLLFGSINISSISFDQFRSLLHTNPQLLHKLLSNVEFKTVDEDNIRIDTLAQHPCQTQIDQYHEFTNQYSRFKTILESSQHQQQQQQNNSINESVNDINNLIQYESKSLTITITTMPTTQSTSTTTQSTLLTVLDYINTISTCKSIFTEIDVNEDQRHIYLSLQTSNVIPTPFSYLFLQDSEVLKSSFRHLEHQLHSHQNQLMTCVDTIIAHPLVFTLHKQTQLSTQNAKAKYILQDRTFTSTKMWSKGLTGQNQAVIVGDTGVDHDHCMFHDQSRPTSQYKSHIGTSQATNPDYLQRKIIWYITNWGDDLDDSGGHGTHVAGTIAGIVDPNYPNNDAKNALAPYSGHGKDTKLIVLDFKKNGSSGLNIPEDLYRSIFVPFTTRVSMASISSHSWGGDVGYTSYSLSTDQFCYNNPYHLIVFAGGNNGEQGFTTILSPGDSKNVLTVGATENLSELPGLTIKYAQYDSNTITPNRPFETITMPFVMASFGRPTLVLSNSGSIPIVVAENIYACETLKSDTYNTIYTNAIVFVRRGDCSFVTKAGFVFGSGAAVMIVVNNVDTQPTTMGVDTTQPVYQRPFYAAMVAKRYGEPVIRYLESIRTSEQQQSTFNIQQDKTLQPIGLVGIGPVAYQGGDSFGHNMADFSSRGPTRDGRIKPDLVAPGKAIYSARSDGSAGRSVNCPTGTQGIISLSGTSMSTPAVAGELSLVRQYFEQGFYWKYISTFVQPFYQTSTIPMNIYNSTSSTDSTFSQQEQQYASQPALDELRNNFKITSAAMKSVAIASTQPAQGNVRTQRKGESSFYDSVTFAPMSPHQGWGLFNVDRILQFHDEPNSFSLLDKHDDITIETPYPPSRLYVFDSQTEDLVNIRYVSMTNDNSGNNPNSNQIPTTLSSNIKKSKEKHKFDKNGSNFYTVDKLPEILTDITSSTQKLLSSKSISMVTSPTSFFIDNPTSIPDFQRCAPAITPTIPTDIIPQQDTNDPTHSTKELYSCAITSQSTHQHCLTVQPEDIMHHIEYSLYNGASPTHTLHESTITFSNLDAKDPLKSIPYVDIHFLDFANPSTPTSNDPVIARATLVWNDVPGTLADERVLVNNLDLSLIASSTFRVVLTSTQVSLITTTTDPTTKAETHSISKTVDIDWNHYRILFPRLFTLSDGILQKHNYTLSPTTDPDFKTTFASPLFHSEDNSKIFSTGNSHSATENQKVMRDPSTMQQFVDVINNVEQVSLNANSLNVNAYVLAAAIHLGQVVNFNAIIKTQHLSTSLQHYALTVTGAMPSGFYIPTRPPQQSEISSTSFSTQQTEQFQSLRTSTTGTCSLDSLNSICPNNCNTHLNPLNKCVAGRCVCGTKPIQSTAYNGPIRIQSSSIDCSVEPTVLDGLCIDPKNPSTNTCPKNSNPADTFSSPLVGTISRLIQPWQWHYYTLPAAIVKQALQLKALFEVSKEPQTIDDPTKPMVVQPDTVYIGIKFTVRVANASKPLIKGDPDLYISNYGFPTLNRFNYANRICDSCSVTTQKRNQSPTPAGFVEQSLFDEKVELTNHSISPTAQNNLIFDSLLEKFHETQTQQQQSSSSLSIINSLFETVSTSIFTPLVFPTTADIKSLHVPKALLDDKDVIWIDGSYFDSSPNKTVTLGVYGYCCTEAFYDLSIYGLHATNKPLVQDGSIIPDVPTETKPTPTESDPAEQAYKSKSDKYIFSLFFAFATVTFICCLLIMCCKKNVQNYIQTSYCCAPLRLCCNFNKIPVAQENSRDAYSRHGILYRVLGCYYWTTYLFFCFKSETMEYSTQVNDSDTATVSNGSLQNVSVERPHRDNNNNNNDLSDDIELQPQPKPKPLKRTIPQHDATVVADLGPQVENPFNESSQPTNIPTSAQRSLDEFEFNETHDQFILEQESSPQQQQQQQHNHDFDSTETSKEWDLPPDPNSKQ